MSNIGATNSSNIDAQLAAKRAEEERKKAQAAKLEAEQKAKAEEKKAQTDAKAADAQKGKDVPAAKPKAEDVSIHTAQKDGAQTSKAEAGKASVYTQSGSAQETKSTAYTSPVYILGSSDTYSGTLTLSGNSSLFENQYGGYEPVGDTVELTDVSSLERLASTLSVDGKSLDSNNGETDIINLAENERNGSPTLAAVNKQWYNEKILNDFDTLKKITEELGFKNVKFYDYEHADIVRDWKSKIDERKEEEAKNPLDFVKDTKKYCVRRLQYAAEDAEYFDKIVGGNIHLVGEFIEHFKVQDNAMKVSFLHWTAKYSEKLYSDETLTKKLGEILTSKDIDAEVKAAALYSIARNEKLSKEDKDKFFEKLDAEKVKKVIVDQIRSKCLTKEEAERVIADFNNALNEFSKGEGSGAQTGANLCAAGAGAGCQNKEHVCALHNSGDNNNPVRSKALGQGVSAYKKDLQTKAVECAMELPQEGRQAAISRLHELDKENQVPATRIVSRHEMTTEDDRILLSSQIPKFDENVQTEASRVFLAEERNTQSARVMEAFATQIPNLKVSIEDRTAVYNQVSALNIVNDSVLQETRNQLATQYYELTNRTDFDDFVNTIGSNSANMNVGASVNVASTVPISGAENISAGTAILSNTTDFSANDRALGLWGVAKSVGIQIREALLKYGLANGVKPTISQFVDMLDKEILSAEVVVKAGYKDALIQQFSSLSSDAQSSVLETLTIEEKIMMRQKGLLPRRFWDQVEKLVAQKALDGGDVSTSDANLLARTASNSVLYQCLNDSSIRLSAQSRSLFQKTLIDNHYLKRDVNGQYKKA